MKKLRRIAAAFAAFAVMFGSAGAFTGGDPGPWIITASAEDSGFSTDETGMLKKYKGTDKSVTIPETVDGVRVTSIGDYAFSSCTDITEVVIPPGVTSIGKHSFQGCTKLSSVTLPDGLLTIDSYAFEGCKALKNIDIPSGVTSIGGFAFHGSGLTSVNIPAGIGKISGASFHGCNITELNVPEGITLIDDLAFANCSSLVSVKLPKSLTALGVCVFENCGSLKSFSVPEENTAYQSIDGVLFDKSGKTLVQYANGKEITAYSVPEGVEKIGDYSFRGSKISEITIPGSVRSIGIYAFMSSNALPGVTIPESVTGIGDGAFDGCSSMKEITIPGTVSDISDWTFMNCTALETVRIGAGVKTIGVNAFSGCKVLTDIDIPDTVTEIKGHAFSSCYKLETITMPDSVTSLGADAFIECFALKNVTLSKNIVSIGDYAFSSCRSLVDLTLPEKLETLGNSALRYCTALKNLVVYDNVTTLGDYTFTGSENIGDLYYTGSKEQWAAVQKDKSNLRSQCIIHYDFDPSVYKDINELEISPISSYTYSGSANRPVPVITDGEKKLKKTMDFTLAYSNYVLAGTATVTITGKGNYYGTRSVDYIIEPLDMSGFTVVAEDGYTYTGSELDPALKVKNGAVTLTSGKDYTVSYENNINVGTGTATFTGTGNYTGTLKSSFSIVPRDISGLTASVSSQPYKGVPHTPAVTVKDGDSELEAGKDYSVSYENNTNAGTAKVIITGTGNYTGTLTASFTINRRDVRSLTVEDIPDQLYTGEAVVPSLTVKDGDALLIENTHYTAVYSNNKNVGTATVTITGIGNYIASRSIKFNIRKPAPTPFDMTDSSGNIAGAEITSEGDLSRKLKAEDSNADHINLVVKENSSPDEADITKIAAVLPANTEVYKYLKAELKKYAGTTEAGTISETASPIKITMKVPEEIISTDDSRAREYIIVRLYNGSAEILDAVCDGTYISFETDKFSDYAVAYLDLQYGDVNGDDTVTMADLLLLKQYMVKVPGKSVYKAAADVTADNDVTMADLLRLKQYMVKVPGIALGK